MCTHPSIRAFLCALAEKIKFLIPQQRGKAVRILPFQHYLAEKDSQTIAEGFSSTAGFTFKHPAFMYLHKGSNFLTVLGCYDLDGGGAGHQRPHQ